jgi:hypothetical protein
MKRFVLACLLCSAMLGLTIFVFMPRGSAKALSSTPAKENVIEALLNLPAPPPPNPLEPGPFQRDENFYDPKNPPPDDASIDDLIDYWTHQSGGYRGELYYLPHPSEKTLERLFDEAERDHSLVSRLMRVLPDDKRTGEIVKELYDRTATDGTLERDDRKILKEWLTMNSPYYSDTLERVAAKTHDSNQYVDLNSENHVLALTRHDWERARPIVEQMYRDNLNPVSRVLAMWALYRHAIETDDIGDTDRYRGELMRLVEDRNQPIGVRDKANDALDHEKDFLGRDEWTFSLFEDETLVNMPQYSMLTTLIMYSPPDKYVPKMIELLGSSSKTVRTAAARNLLVAQSRSPNPEIIRALLPWLENPNWLESKGANWMFGGSGADEDPRKAIVDGLQKIYMPESVPALIAMLDEKSMRAVPDYSTYASTNANSAVAVSNVMRLVNTNTTAVNAMPAMKQEAYYPFRDAAIRALATQKDPRAGPALRRVLTQVMPYQRIEIVNALLACSGFSVQEELDALEAIAKKLATINEEEKDIAAYQRLYGETFSSIYGGGNANFQPGAPMRQQELESLLGITLMSTRDVNDTLLHATIDRIEALDSKDPQLASALRRIVLNWQGTAVSALLLRDLKNGRAGSAAIVRLLIERKTLREKLMNEVSDAGTGTPTAAAIAACIQEDTTRYEAILESEKDETKTALLACSRLIRAPLSITKVAANLKSTNTLLKSAAELYLESEDSPESRTIVLGLHPGEAKVLGATTCFKGLTGQRGSPFSFVLGFLPPQDYAYNADYVVPSVFDEETTKSEKKLEKEVKESSDLLGIYAYDKNFVHIYKDKAVFSWMDDPSRYRERNLSSEEFTRLKEYLAAQRVNELKPFLICRGGEGACPSKELLMLSRDGGSRIYERTSRTPEFFVGLEKILAGFRAEPSAIKYTLSKTLPGLEILFADSDLEAQTVWKQGPDLRVVVSSAKQRAKIEEELADLEDQDDSDDEEEPPRPGRDSKAEKLRQSRQYEGYAWHKVEGGKLSGDVAQPTGVEYIPPRDGLEVQPVEEQWKARSEAFEIRADSTGLYKVAHGKLTKLKSGDYSSPVVSSNGKWLAVTKIDEEDGPQLIRYNLITNREYNVKTPEEYLFLEPAVYVSALGKFFVVESDRNGEGEGEYEPSAEGSDDDSEEAEQPDSDVDSQPSSYFLDPETGVLTPATGEVRPLSDQTFRPLQSTTKPNEFWSAIPGNHSNETLVGIYDSRLLRFKPILALPKITFGSMDMWADEAEGKIYFVYNGHLLSMPFANNNNPKK